MDDSLVAVGRAHVERPLVANGGEPGPPGSSRARQPVWARDSKTCGLRLRLCENAEGRSIHVRSLETLRRRLQSPLAQIRHNVSSTHVADPALITHEGRLEVAGRGGMSIEDTLHAGCVDGDLWSILGNDDRLLCGEDLDFLRRAPNECGLFEVHAAMARADLFASDVVAHERVNVFNAEEGWPIPA